jgi:exonuclease VII small subunit
MFEKADRLMATYIEASDEFGQSANALLQHINLLPQALNAYRQAMTASAELRRVLDKRDEMLQTLMRQLEEAGNAPFSKPLLDDKKPEVMKASAATVGGVNVAKTFP